MFRRYYKLCVIPIVPLIPISYYTYTNLNECKFCTLICLLFGGNQCSNCFYVLFRNTIKSKKN